MSAKTIQGPRGKKPASAATNLIGTCTTHHSYENRKSNMVNVQPEEVLV
jgi:hypothetical protein